MRRKKDQPPPTTDEPPLMACEIGQQVTLWDEEAHHALPPGHYDVIAVLLQMRMEEDGTIKYKTDYPMCVRRLA